ncbi:MAG: hypothetical protein U1F35_18620 [Steroidobacteraceae bacterium]
MTRRIRWPLALGTLDEDAIVVRYSTMPASPLAVQSTTLGHRPGLIESAMGLAYLAHCPANERAILLGVLSMTTFGRSMTRVTIARHVPVLQETAGEIASGVRDRMVIGP